MANDGTALQVNTDGEGAWADLTFDDIAAHGVVERVSLLPNGTAEGRATIALLIRLDGVNDGRLVIAETTYRLARMAAVAIAASPLATAEGHL